MLQKVDMPSYLPDNVDHSDLTKSFSGGYNNRYLHQQQHTTSSPEPPAPATEDIVGGWPKQITPPLVNGVHNGPDNAVAWPLSNKASFDDTATNARGRTPSGQESITSIRSKRSGGLLDGGKRSLEVPNFSKGPITDDDGYFSAVPTTSRSNGTPRSPNVKPHATGTKDVSPGPSTRSASLALPPTAAPPLPPVNENSPQVASDDRMLRVPHSAHRASSPPAFSHTTSLSSGPSPNPPSRLVHRHTLEVPKATSRNSKDGQSPAGDDAVASATGRFSPNVNTPSRRRGSSQLVRRATRSINSDMHPDEVPQDDDAARWTEHIKQKRASKRKRDEEEEDHVVVGTKIDQNHVNYETAYNMLTGIRFTVSRTNAKMDRELTEADFDAKNKFSFDVTGNELTPSAKYDFKFKDYAPWVFRHLRQQFHLDPADYLMSLTAKYILSELGSPGKSGSFFYFSRDYKYIIKTIHHAEHKFLRKILRQYYDHVRANPNTLLSQFYGLHRVKIPYGRKIHFVVMNNLFPPHRDIHRTFDLKGSTVGRDFREEELEKNPRATLKDLNWLRRNLHLEFGPVKKQAFVEQMQRDVALLQKLKIMDYSMLVGIHDLERGNEENLRDKTLQVFSPGGDKTEGGAQPSMLMRTPSKLENARKARELRQLIKTERPVPMEQTMERMPDSILDPKKNFYFYSDDGGFRATHEDEALGEEIYYLGIIDCLTHYSFIKRVEHFWKGMSSPESQISAIPPERYGDRFIKFIAGITKTRERAEYEKEHPEIANDVGLAVRRTEGTLDDPQLAGVNLLSPDLNGNPAGTDKVMRKAEKEAEKSRRHGASEDDVPDRSISSVRSPDGDRQDLITLPVIGEAAESGSANSASMTPQRSKESLRSLRGHNIEPHRAQHTVLGNAEMPSQSLGEVPPPTPPKSDGPPSHPFIKADFEQRGRVPDRPPPTPPKDERDMPRLSRESQRSNISRESLDKALPRLPVPQASSTFSISPARASADEMERLRARVAGLTT